MRRLKILGIGGGLALTTLLGPVQVEAQIRLQDLVITGGLSAEAYRGNLAAVTVAVVVT